MTEEEQARLMAEEWQRSHPEFAGRVAHLVSHHGYWWASFRPPGASRPGFGGTVLLIDVSRQALTAASGSRAPEERIADYEASLS